jgi:hypothetical protein
MYNSPRPLERKAVAKNEYSGWKKLDLSGKEDRVRYFSFAAPKEWRNGASALSRCERRWIEAKWTSSQACRGPMPDPTTIQNWER